MVLERKSWGLAEIVGNRSRCMLRKFWRAWESLGSHSRSRLARNWQQGHLNRSHYGPLEVRIDVYVLGLLWSYRRRGHHYSRGLYLGRHVHSLRWGGVMWVLQGKQRLQLLLLEQAPDWLLLRRWRWRRRGRLRLWRRN